MTEKQSIINSIALGVGVVGNYMIDWDFRILTILVLMMLGDVLIGVIFSGIRGDFASSKMRKGLYLKWAELVMVILLLLLQSLLVDLKMPVPAGSTLTLAFIFKDFASIIETFTKNGIKLPKFIINWFDGADLNKTKEVKDEKRD